MTNPHLVARRTLWFATAYTIVIIVHEAAHALTARGLGLEATLFHFWVNVDSANQATVGQKAAFGVAGPVSSLVVGLVAWVAYRRVGGWAAMPLLYLAAHGVSNFFGNLMSAAFVGDFSNVATWMGLPMGVRYAMTFTGALVTLSVMFAAGRELARWTPTPTSRGAVALAVVIPAAIGTALIILVNQPVPLQGFAAARTGESMMWLFAAVGAATAPASTQEAGRSRATLPDLAVAGVVIAAVRVMVAGIPLIPS